MENTENNKSELIYELNKLIIDMEKQRILAQRRKDFSSEITWENKREELEEIRDKMVMDETNEEILEDARRILKENR